MEENSRHASFFLALIGGGSFAVSAALFLFDFVRDRRLIKDFKLDERGSLTNDELAARYASLSTGVCKLKLLRLLRSKLDLNVAFCTEGGLRALALEMDSEQAKRKPERIFSKQAFSFLHMIMARRSERRDEVYAMLELIVRPRLTQEPISMSGMSDTAVWESADGNPHLPDGHAVR